MQWGRECVNYFAYCSKKLYYDKGTDISGLWRMNKMLKKLLLKIAKSPFMGKVVGYVFQ